MPNTSMSFSQLYFSTEGRIPRSTYWLKYYLPLLGISMLGWLLDYAMGTYDAEYGIGLVSGTISFLIIWPSIAIYVKRIHDRDRSGLFLLLLFVPLLNIWPTIEILFLKGTEGPNQFGEDPLGDVVEVFE